MPVLEMRHQTNQVWTFCDCREGVIARKSMFNDNVAPVDCLDASAVIKLEHIGRSRLNEGVCRFEWIVFCKHCVLMFDNEFYVAYCWEGIIKGVGWVGERREGGGGG